MRRPVWAVLAVLTAGCLATAGATPVIAANRTPAWAAGAASVPTGGGRPFGAGFSPTPEPSRTPVPDQIRTPTPSPDSTAPSTSASAAGTLTSAPASAIRGDAPGEAATSRTHTSTAPDPPPPPPAPTQPSGLASVVAQSPSAQQTDQILGVIGSGSSASVHLFEKQPDGMWVDVVDTSGHVGAAGVGAASESSTATPRGSWPLTMAFGTGPNPGAGLPYRQADPQSCWISDVNDPQYNTWQERLSCPAPNEQLAAETVAYRYAIVIGYNTARVPGAGSAFFVHVDTGGPTAGCVSVPQEVMLTLMQRIHPGARIVNVTSPGELASY